MVEIEAAVRRSWMVPVVVGGVEEIVDAEARSPLGAVGVATQILRSQGKLTEGTVIGEPFSQMLTGDAARKVGRTQFLVDLREERAASVAKVRAAVVELLKLEEQLHDDGDVRLLFALEEAARGLGFAADAVERESR